MGLLYCNKCMRSKEAVEFKRWHEDKSKQRICDECFHQDQHNQHYLKVVSERNAKKKSKGGMLKGHHLSDAAKQQRAVRERIAELHEQRRIKELYEL